MSLITVFRLLKIGECSIVPVRHAVQARHGKDSHYGKKIQKGVSKIQIPVEKDINTLLTYCSGSNIYKEGEDIKLKPDSEYPDWLWNLRTTPPKLSELDPNTKQYWRLRRKLALVRNNRIQKYSKTKQV